MEEENKRILEFAKYQQRKEEDRMASARKKEEAKDNLHKMVGGERPAPSSLNLSITK